MLMLLTHPGHGLPTGHLHLSDSAIVWLIATVAILLVLMTRGEEGK